MKKRSPYYILSLKLILAVLVLTETLYAKDTFTISENHSETDVRSELLNEYDPHETHFFKVRGVPTINVHTVFGDIELVSNPDIDGVRVDLYVERSFTLWSGPRSLDDFRIIIRQQGDRIIASVDERRTGSSRRRGDVKFHFVIHTPFEVNTQLRTVSGDIHIENLVGEQFLQNQTGHISAINNTGRTQISSSMGDITMDRLNGVTFAKSVNGNIHISNSSGETRLRTVAGDIIVQAASGTLIAATTSGHIVSDFKQVSKGVYLETISGNIELAMPLETSYRIEGEAMQFDFSGLVQDSVTNLNRRNRMASLTTGEGEIPVQLSTIAGRIKVSHTE